jgi:hypothetical protein
MDTGKKATKRWEKTYALVHRVPDPVHALVVCTTQLLVLKQTKRLTTDVSLVGLVSWFVNALI